MEDLTGQVYKTNRYYFAHGGLADIWKGAWKSTTGGASAQVAIKVIRASWREPAYLEQLKRKLLREGRVWNQLQHPHITPFYGVSFDADRPQSPCLVCPYYKNGDLTEYLQNNPHTDRLAMLAQVAAGLTYLHDIKPHAVVHGDIKGSNILVNDDHQASLTDFGLSRIVESSGFTTKSVGGTCRWMAYELLAPSEDDDEEEYIPPLTTASDVWAFGMTILEALTGRMPFMHIRNDSTVILTIIKGALPAQPPEIEDGIWQLLLHCWTSNPQNRPSVKVVAGVLDIMCSKSLSRDDVDTLIRVLSSVPGSEATTPDTMHEQPSPSSQQLEGDALETPLLYPYQCHWPSCQKTFTDLGSCQTHKCFHWESYQRRGATFSARRPASGLFHH